MFLSFFRGSKLMGTVYRIYVYTLKQGGPWMQEDPGCGLWRPSGRTRTVGNVQVPPQFPHPTNANRCQNAAQERPRSFPRSDWANTRQRTACPAATSAAPSRSPPVGSMQMYGGTAPSIAYAGKFDCDEQVHPFFVNEKSRRKVTRVGLG